MNEEEQEGRPWTCKRIVFRGRQMTPGMILEILYTESPDGLTEEQQKELQETTTQLSLLTR